MILFQFLALENLFLFFALNTYHTTGSTSVSDLCGGLLTRPSRANNQMRSSGVTVVGSSFMDLVHKVHQLPKPGETIFAREYVEGLGGKGNNQAVMVSKLMRSARSRLNRVNSGVSGHTDNTENNSNISAQSSCMFITGVGNDEFAHMMLHSFQQHFSHVDQSVFQFTDTTTGRAMINVDDQGRNSIVLIRGANARLSPSHVDQCWSLVQDCSRVLVVQNEIPLETTVHALRRAKDSGMLTVFNTAPAPKATELNGDIVQYVHVLCPNETEAISIIGDDHDDDDDALAHKQELSVEDGKRIAKKLYEKYVRQNGACSDVQIVLTLGDKGAVAYMNKDFGLEKLQQQQMSTATTTTATTANNNQSDDDADKEKKNELMGERILVHFPLQDFANSGKTVVDTTGAGDAFVGSLAYFLSRNVRLLDAIPMSNIVASDSVTKFGSQASFSGDFQFDI